MAIPRNPGSSQADHNKSVEEEGVARKKFPEALHENLLKGWQFTFSNGSPVFL